VLERIIANNERLLQMVNDLLDRAQIEAGKIALNIATFSPHTLIDDLLSVTSEMAKTKNLELAAKVTDNLPMSLSGDPKRLLQVLVNLVGNAIKFTDQGSINVRLYRLDVVHWAMEVADTGKGIPEDQQVVIFEPFQQVDSSVTREHTGFGLGLSIVKQLVNLMGGDIKLSSRVGQGSIFTVVLPLEPVQEKVA
jgi:signal transduction histidine kinase